MNTAPISAHSTVNIEIEDSCNYCCCRPSRRQIRARHQANTQRLNEIKEAELASYRKEVELSNAYKASVAKTETTQKADGVVKEVLGYRVAE